MKNSKLLLFLKQEIVLTIACVLALCSAFLIKPTWEYITYMDFRVLTLLFSLMFLVAGFREQYVFRILGRKLSEKAANVRQLELVLILLCFFFSMFITNDVALITFVPFSIEILVGISEEKELIPVIVLQTIAANLGSMLTPLGNPQNLYLFSVTGMKMTQFLGIMLPYTLLALLLLLCCIFLRNRKGAKAAIRLKEKKFPVVLCKWKLLILSLLFLLCMGTVIRVVPYHISFLCVCMVGLLFFRRLFAKVDYALLGTFSAFFIFVGNMQRIDVIHNFLQEILSGHELLLGILSSQLISNVPATMLLSGFTKNYQPLLIGVNIGGLGTLIASLASLISYKLYTAGRFGKNGQYLKIFTIYNLIFLFLLAGFGFLSAV